MRIFRSFSWRAFENTFNGIWLVSESCITIYPTITRINVLHSINPGRCKIDKRRSGSAECANTNKRICKLDNF